MNVDGLYSVKARTPEEAWAFVKADPLAWIRELAYAHAEALRAGAETAVVECPVLDMDAYRKWRV